MSASVEAGDIDVFMSRVEAAEKRDGGSSIDLLAGYFKDLVRNGPHHGVQQGWAAD